LEHDLEHISQGTLCEEADLEKCKEEHDGPDLDWACEHCPKLPAWRIHPYTRKLLNIRRLQAAGFPIDADMLTYDEWLDLGRVNQWLTPAPFM
jgi:hypothetical protein